MSIDPRDSGEQFRLHLKIDDEQRFGMGLRTRLATSRGGFKLASDTRDVQKHTVIAFVVGESPGFEEADTISTEGHDPL